MTNDYALRTSEILATNDAMRLMWRDTWRKARQDRRAGFKFERVLARANQSMQKHHTWRLEPRSLMLKCLNRALQLRTQCRIEAISDESWQLHVYCVRMDRMQPKCFRCIPEPNLPR